MAAKFHHQIVYLTLKAILAVGSHMKLRTLQRIGALFGPLAFSLSARRRRRIPQHLELALPELATDQRKQLARQIASHLGMNLAEAIWMHGSSLEEIIEICSVSGIEHFENARAKGRGAIMLTGHCGNWEFLNARLSVSGIPVVAAARSLNDDRINKIIVDLRSRFGTEVVLRGKGTTRKLVRSLTDNKVNALLIDQDIKDLSGAFVPFFGRPAWTPTSAAALSLRFGAPIVPTFIHRRDDGSHHAEVFPPLRPTPGLEGQEAIIDLTALATQAIEQQVRAYPAQWVWMHRRWRTQPE